MAHEQITCLTGGRRTAWGIPAEKFTEYGTAYAAAGAALEFRKKEEGEGPRINANFRGWRRYRASRGYNRRTQRNGTGLPVKCCLPYGQLVVFLFWGIRFYRVEYAYGMLINKIIADLK
ncbi:MAG: hypothetical protein LBI67_11245 [Treponema sp.]|jgi:hypothetical protein|nr:hypothetical protein [Treponema sp.]